MFCRAVCVWAGLGRAKVGGCPQIEISPELVFSEERRLTGYLIYWSSSIKRNVYAGHSQFRVEMSGKLLQYREGKEPSSILRALLRRGRSKSWACTSDNREIQQRARRCLNSVGQVPWSDDHSSEDKEVSALMSHSNRIHARSKKQTMVAFLHL